MISCLHRLRRSTVLSAFALLTSGVLAACASDTGGAVTTSSSRSGALPGDTAVPTSPAGTPMMGAGVGSSMGSNGLGGGRGSF